ncbi:nitrite and sulphite reductase 4Fe-4S region [Desulfoscipio gibsoniae]|uniref:NAD(P)H-nitrite reductase n=1 Tax=Desulfoscipio gibsoniae DSM 7213 TaxID=767817 RepID=R4KRY2_9FIRM|nr:nitrite and sulphite reductase 4Fe-4S region [Desulfoscipio gibsoniae]AGL03340.1 NAD(P)H-nitrite reductase [Desulfoscipio gibsoniae DSM 7213]
MEGIVKQTNGAVAVIPATPGGLVNGEQLLKIAQLVNEGAGLAKFTTGEHIVILTAEDKVDQVRQELASVGLGIAPVGPVVRNVKTCPGGLCEFALQEALNDGLSIDKKFSGQDMPNAVKIAFSGCPRNCMEARCSDIGFVGTKNGYKLYIGGKGGNQILGELLDKDITSEELINYTEHIITVYKNNANPKERLASVINRIGIEQFKINLK